MNKLYIDWLEEIAHPLWLVKYYQQLHVFNFDLENEDEHSN